MKLDSTIQGGIDAFQHGASQMAWLTYVQHQDTAQFVRVFGEDYANIRLADLCRPRRFLAQMAGAPPVQFGTIGFRSELVDDRNPARHYSAFLLVGYYVPVWAAAVILISWEVAGFIRYGGKWSSPDVRCGWLGIRHGRLVRQYGAVVLPGLIAAELAIR